MPFQRPTIAELIARIGADFTARLPGSKPLLRNSFIWVLVRVIAGAVHGLYGYLAYTADQIHPETSDLKNMLRHAARRGMTWKTATAASGSLVVSGSDGSEIPAGTLLQSAAGQEYATTAAALIAGGTASIPVTASSAGYAGNLAAGETLTLINPLEGIEAEAVVDGAGLSGGTDDETRDALLYRIQQRDRQPAMGGAAHDYITWALEIPGVTRAWCFPLQRGNGTVDTGFVTDNDPAGMIPSAAQVQAVQDHIATQRPVTANHLAFAPTAVALDFTIQIAPAADAAVKSAVAAELADLLSREAQPDDGSGSATILISHINEAISIAAGETDHVLVLPAANVTYNAGEMPVMGVITWA